MSEDLLSRQAKRLGRFEYLSLGSTTLAQLKQSRFIRGKLASDEERRKPDGIVFLPLGSIKAVVEVKTPSELTPRKLPHVIRDYSAIARAVCKLLIVTDGKNTYWYNALTEQPVRDEAGHPFRLTFDPSKVDAQKLSAEVEMAIVSAIEKADYSLSETNDQFQRLRIIDPTSLAKSVWQKIWISTGKEPEKCLYNVVEILVFKYLSDIGVLSGNYSFQRIIRVLHEEDEGERRALEHYANISRKHIRDLFPKGADGTTIINGTIFVNETGNPNLSQAGLFAEVIRAFQNYDDEFGSLQYIDRQFKTRLYESFLRQQAGIRSLGQYFTPRNVIQPIVRMSKASELRAGDGICDPFCGVGGFLLEAIAENEKLLNQFKPVNARIRPKIIFRGYDKGTDEKDDERTIILAKANMLVYLSDLLSQFHSDAYLKQFAGAFNEVFHLIRSNLGTYERVDPEEKYDLILTNPPYVTSGSGSIRSAIEAANLAEHYSHGGRGTESLAIQWIIGHLKPDGEAFVIVPDGLLNQCGVLEHIKSECDVLLLAALPSRTFYSTPKKTYILGLRKKAEAREQVTPVFTYLVSEIGESRDTRRVTIPENDLLTMEHQFRYFRAAPLKYTSTDPRCKIRPWAEFSALRNWLVDRSWSHEERVTLGIAEDIFEVDVETFRDLVADAKAALDGLFAELS